MSSKKYHPYVFDESRRRFVGAFEEMYRAELKENFDSWHQDDTRAINRKVLLALADQYQFAQVVDMGCGKGSLTHCFKKANNAVIGVDIAPTAITIASERYPDVDFRVLDLNNFQSVDDFLRSLPTANGTRLVVCAELLSYLEHWEDFIALLANYCDYLAISLYIPENPIGFVKSSSHLSSIIGNHFRILEIVSMELEKFHIILAERK